MIGIFDSGIGGVTVLRELLKILPEENYLYYSDSKNNPYGDKDPKTLLELTDKIVKKLIDKGSKIIVIACNTAGSNCKDYLRKKYNIPIVVIEPAYKMVYDYARDKKTLLMATNATLESHHFKKLYKKYNNQNTILCSCSGLADLIERKDKKAIKNYLKEKLKNYKNIENVVLGCTHYPLIKDEIKEILGDVVFFDGSRGVSMQTKRILTEQNLLNKKGGHITFIDSSEDKEKEKLFFNLANNGKI